jgi:hypothetical protein
LPAESCMPIPGIRFLASLPKEAQMLVRSYDEVVAKYALPAPQDDPQNQIELKPAIEAVEVVECTSQPHEAP